MITDVQLDYLESNYFGAYFHQDWLMEFDQASEAVQSFLRVSTFQEVETVKNLIAQLLVEVKDDDKLAELVWSRLGCAYDSSVEGKSLRTWLVETVEQMQNWIVQLTQSSLKSLLDQVVAPKIAHTIKEHVQKTDEDLRNGLGEARFPYRSGLSSFSNLTIAEESIAFIIKEHYVTIQQVLRQVPNGQQFPPFVSDLKKPTGNLATNSDSSSVIVTSARLILIRDVTSSSGYSILSAYPIVAHNYNSSLLSSSELLILAELFGGYFFQLWDNFYTNADHAVTDYLRSRPHAEIVKLHDTLQKTIELIKDDGVLVRILTDELGCEYNPQLQGQSDRAWLQHVVMFVDRWLQQM